ncbi:CPBP family intramembrane glutamic endopeptidase [Nocardioides sp. MAHUQ-72]|uniref:CPBP family intramembrane glutamic endopeptidase n=1 Tax=unclassified Nocardioides TaxID=2615069 RepID=UPI003621F992
MSPAPSLAATSRPASTSQRTPAERWPQLAWLGLAGFAGPWTIWLSRIAQDHGLIGWHLPQGLALWSILPALALAVAGVSGRAGLRDLAGRLLRWHAPVWTYLVALGLPLGIAGATAALVAGTGGEVPVGRLMSLPAALAYLAYGTGLFLLTEEAAWRGALLPGVQHRVGPAAASLIVGAAWAVWHLPLLANPGEHDRGLPVAPFLILVIGTSVLVTGLVNAAGGSVIVAAVFHASFDACYSYLGIVGPEHVMLIVAAALTTTAAAALMLATRGRLLLSREAIR